MEALECNGCDIMANNMGTFLHHFAMNLQFLWKIVPASITWNSTSVQNISINQMAMKFFEPLAVAFAR